MCGSLFVFDVRQSASAWEANNWSDDSLSFLNMKIIQWNLDLTKAKGLLKYVRYNNVSLYRGSFQYILLLLGRRITVRYDEDFVV